MEKRFFKEVLVLVVSLSICLFLGQPIPSMAAEKPIVIGGSISLTGGFSANARWVERGYQFWAEEVNAKGGLLGRPVKLLIYDDKGDPKEAVNMAEKVITVDKVDLLLGGYPGSSCNAVMPVAEKYKMLYVCMGGHMPSFSQGFTYSFGSPPLMGQWTFITLFDWIKTIPADNRPKTVAAYTMNNPIGAATIGTIYPGCKELGIKILIDEQFNLPLSTADTMITKAKQMKADMFFITAGFPEGVMAVRTAKAFNYNPSVIVPGIAALIPEWTKELGKDGEGAIAATHWHYKLKYPGNDKIIKAAREKFNEDAPPIYFGLGYAWVQSLQQAVEGAKTLDQTKLRDWMRANGVKTIAGNFKFDERGLPAPFIYVTQVINGKVEIIWPLEQRTHEPIYPKPAWN